MYWFKGNLEIRIKKLKLEELLKGEKLEIRYYNLINSKDGNSLKLDEEHLSGIYTLDYWEKHIKPKEDKAFKESVEDI